jgi:SAM-dependent methyltransferase
MSIDSQLKKIESMYSDNLQKMGVDSRSVGWNSEACQKLRFSKLAAVLGQDEDFSINDLGCGYGSLLDFLSKDLDCQVGKYHGYDISKDMLDAATRILSGYPKELIDLRQSKDISTVADYSFVSGTFNVRFEATYDEWKQHISDCLSNLDAHSTKGFAFNLLTSYVDWEEPHLFYGEPSFWFDYCKKNFSKKVSLLHDYDLWEWTILVRK